MKASQEPKYMIVDAEGRELPNAQLANRETGEPIPPEEPVFTLRGKDLHAPDTIANYLARLPEGPHADAVRARLVQFHDYQVIHPTRCKAPD